MVIDFNGMTKEKLDHFKGGEKHVSAAMYADDNNRIMVGTLIPGASIGIHTHQGSSEAIYILKGTAKSIYDGKEEYISEGMCHYCQEGHEHCLINESNENVEYFAVVPNHK